MMVTCLAYCLDQEFWKAIDYLKEQVRVLKEQQEKDKRILLSNHQRMRLGNNPLSAMEKEDNEALAILRAKHERIVMEMVEHVEYGQLQEAVKSNEGLLQSLALAVQRYTYYERQLGKKADEVDKKVEEPKQALGELDRDSLGKMEFTMEEPATEDLEPRDVEVDIAQDLGASGGKIIIPDLPYGWWATERGLCQKLLQKCCNCPSSQASKKTSIR